MQSYWYDKKKFKEHGCGLAFWIMALTVVVMMLIATLFPACFDSDPVDESEYESSTVITEDV